MIVMYVITTYIQNIQNIQNIQKPNTPYQLPNPYTTINGKNVYALSLPRPYPLNILNVKSFDTFDAVFTLIHLFGVYILLF